MIGVNLWLSKFNAMHVRISFSCGYIQYCLLCTYLAILIIEVLMYSVSALLMMVTLKKLASTGCTLLFTLNQSSTEVFGLFDRICLLSNGNTLFFGETLACLQVNPHSYMIRLLPFFLSRNCGFGMVYIIHLPFNIEHMSILVSLLLLNYLTTQHYPSLPAMKMVCEMKN